MDKDKEGVLVSLYHCLDEICTVPAPRRSVQPKPSPSGWPGSSGECRLALPPSAARPAGNQKPHASWPAIGPAGCWQVRSASQPRARFWWAVVLGVGGCRGKLCQCGALRRVQRFWRQRVGKSGRDVGSTGGYCRRGV